jgi:hypothetical protein
MTLLTSLDGVELEALPNFLKSELEFRNCVQMMLDSLSVGKSGTAQITHGSMN